MKFVKMHGCGNDYVYLDAFRDEGVAARVGGEGWVELVRRMSDRHKGIGSDGVIAVCRPSRRGAHVRMRMFNADGSESEMCGNGVRCVAKFAHDRLGIAANPMRVETGNGVLTIEYRASRGRVVEATVDMGRPILNPRKAGLAPEKAAWPPAPTIPGDREWGVETKLGLFIPGTPVSMGNPHFVVQLSFATSGYMTPRELASIDLARIGPAIEHNPAFPGRTNLHFVAVQSRTRAIMRTWERGAGITQACGTGACATLVACVLTGRLAREATLQVPGGRLRIRWDKKSDHVFMTGEAVDVFEGEWADR